MHAAGRTRSQGLLITSSMPRPVRSNGWRPAVRWPQGRVHQAQRPAARRPRRGGHRRPADQPGDQGVVPKNWRLHIEAVSDRAAVARAGDRQRLTAHYRVLEQSGRKDHRAGEGLSARTVRYLHTIVHSVLGQAVKDGCCCATRPTRRRRPGPRRPRRRRCTRGTPAQLAAFLGWAAGTAQNYPLWHTLAMTGMRRGEALALRWRDVDLDAGTVSVRRSAGMVRNAGEGAERRGGRHQERQAAGGRPGRRGGRGAARLEARRAARWRCSWSRPAP